MRMARQLTVEYLDKKFEDFGKVVDKKLEDFEKHVDKKFDDFAVVVAECFASVDKRFEAVDKRFDAVDKRFEGIEKRLDEHDKRFEGIEKTLVKQDKRFEKIELKLDRLVLEMFDLKLGQKDLVERVARLEDSHERTFKHIDEFLVIVERHESEIAALRGGVQRIEERLG